MELANELIRRRVWTMVLIKVCVVVLLVLSAVLPYQNFNALVLMALCAIIGGWVKWQPIFFPMVLFSAWSLFSATMGFEDGQRWSSSDFLFIYIFAPLLILPAIEWGARDVRLIHNLLFLSLLFMSAVIVAQSLWGVDLDRRPFFIAFTEFNPSGYVDAARMPGIWGNAMRYPFAIVIISVYLLDHFFCNRSDTCGKSFLTAFFLIVNLWLSKSRSAIGAVILVLPMVFLKQLKVKKILISIILGIVLLTISLFLLCQFDSFRKRMDRVLAMQDGRVTLWQDSYTIFKERPFMGHGGRKRVIHAYNKIPKEEKRSLEFSDKGSAAHNSLFAIACSYGIVGLVVWLWFMIALMVYAYRHGYKTTFNMLVLYHLLGILYHISEARAMSALLFTLIGLDIAFRNQGLIRADAVDGLQHLERSGSGGKSNVH